MNQAELKPFLETNDVLGADCISSPQAFIKVLTIPTAELGSRVIHIVDRSERLDHTFYLSKLADIASRVSWSVHISTERKPCFVFPV